jgi:hypothetical protein
MWQLSQNDISATIPVEIIPANLMKFESTPFTGMAKELS